MARKIYSGSMKPLQALPKEMGEQTMKKQPEKNRPNPATSYWKKWAS